MADEVTVCKVGYVAGNDDHVLINVLNPSLTSVVPKPEIVQVAMSVEDAKRLRDELSSFLVANPQPNQSGE